MAKDKQQMSALVEQDRALNLSQAKKVMAERIKEVYVSPYLFEHSMNEPTIKRLEFIVDDVSLLQWLAVQKSSVKTYWSDRQGEFEMAGIGMADVVYGEEEIDHDLIFTRLNRLLVDGNDNLRYYGGIRFSEYNESIGDTLWKGFGNYRFVIPRFELLRQSDGTHLVCNVVLGNDKPGADAVLDELGDIVSLIESSDTGLPGITARSDHPDREGWKTMVEAALLSINTTELKKLVLARQTTFDYSSKPKPVCLLERLKQVTHGCSHFYFQLNDDIAFIGATPERLYQRSKRTIKSEALAGTCPRGTSKDTDKALGKQLLQSEKDLREHRYVADHVENVLGDLCPTGVHKDDLSLLQLATVQHLITRLEGTLAPDVSDGEILVATHPTPAVGGYPVDLAVKKIQELEPFDRGWYAGPVGWVGCDATEFAVAIRSGLVVSNKLHLFNGAGIIKGSTAESEWSEIENKLSGFTKAIIA